MRAAKIPNEKGEKKKRQLQGFDGGARSSVSMNLNGVILGTEEMYLPVQFQVCSLQNRTIL